MYNRYIPSPDGSYQKNRMQDRPPQPEKPPHSQPKPEIKPQPDHPSPPHPESQQRSPNRPESIGAFLRGLLPNGIDTSDLIIILLLMLMNDGNEKNQNTGILTIALYLLL